MKIHIHDQQERNEVLEVLVNLDEENDIYTEKKHCHLLVIDDDPLFRKLVRTAAFKRGISVTEADTVAKVEKLARNEKFDLAIIDFFLEGKESTVTGADIADQLDYTPSLLVSQSRACLESAENWPNSVRKFCSKVSGVEAILDQALKLLLHNK